MTTSEDWIWITLIPERLNFCDREGALRTERRRNQPHKNNLAKDFERDLLRDQNAMKAEAATMLYFSCQGIPVTWDLGDQPGKADINDDIDAKLISTFRHRLIMQLDACLDWYYVLCCNEQHPRYCLLGWALGHDIKRLAPIRELQVNRPAYVLENDYLQPMRKLVTILKRQDSQ